MHITYCAKIAKYIDIYKYFSDILVNDFNNVNIVLIVIIMDW